MLKKIMFGAAAVAVGYFVATDQASRTLKAKIAEARSESYDDGVAVATNLVEKKHQDELKKARQAGYDNGFDTATKEAREREKLLTTAHETEIGNIQKVIETHAAEHDKELAKVRAEAYNQGRKDATTELEKQYEKSIKAAFAKGREDALKGS